MFLETFDQAPTRRNESGVALIMVITILAALMVLAVPFINIANHENKASVAPLARAQVRSHAEGLLEYARWQLTEGHAAREAARANSGVGDPSNEDSRSTPDYDTAQEAQVSINLLDAKGNPLGAGDGEPFMVAQNPRGITSDLKVVDAHARPNLLTSPPFLIAATLGRSELSAEIKADTEEIVLDDGEGFPVEGGFLNIEGEIVSYEKREGNRFMGCQRGGAGGLKARAYEAETWVYDDRAREIAMLAWKSPRAKGKWREPTVPEYVKEIALLGRSQLNPIEVDRLSRDFSIIGERWSPGIWGEKVALRADVTPETQQEGDGFRLQLTAIDGFPAGTVVKITDGENTEYGMVARARATRFGSIWLYEGLTNSYMVSQTSVQPLLRHPVNINSASEATLYRIIEGIQQGRNGRARGSNGRVDNLAAKVVVNGILAARPIKDLKHFRSLLGEWADAAELIFNEFLAVAIFRNAVDPGDRNVPFGTVPFSFRSYDWYDVTATAVYNDGSGRELARCRLHERLHVAPRGVLTHELDTQEQFEHSVVRTRQSRYTTTHPIPTGRWDSNSGGIYSRVVRMLYRFGTLGKMTAKGRDTEEEGENDLSGEEGVFPSKTEGDVRLEPARNSGSGYYQPFDGPAYFLPDPTVRMQNLDPEGRRLANGPYEINPRDSTGPVGGGGQSSRGRSGRGRGSRGGSTSSLRGRGGPSPVRVDFWYRIGNGGGQRVLYEYAGQGQDRESISLSIESDGSLVGRVSGRTLQDGIQTFEEVAEVRWLPDGGGSFWQANTWYHLGFAYRGTKPEDLSLFVDGQRRGQPRYQSQLTSAFSGTDTSFTVEDADGWPQRGVVMVGSEVVSFDRSGNSFDVTQFNGANWGRGRRGTKVRSHPSGTVVTVFGYSTAPRGAGTRGAVVIPTGGGALQDGLGPMVAAKFASNATVTLQVPGPGGATIPIPMEVHDPSAGGGNTLQLVADSRGTLDFDCFPASGGYVLIVSTGIGLPGAPAGVAELARYTNRVGPNLVGLQAANSIPNQALSQLANAGGNGVQVLLTRQIHAVRVAGSGPVQTMDSLSMVIPISVAVSNVTGYNVPQAPQSGTTNAGGTFLGQALAEWDTDPEFVQVGLYDFQNLENHQVEWIRYHHVDPQGHLLCDEARYIVATVIAMRTRHLGPGQALLGAHNLLQYTLPMRQQCGTEPFSDGRPSAGTEVIPCIRTVSHSKLEAINVPSFNTNPEAPVNGAGWSAAGWGDDITIEGARGANRRRTRVAWAGVDSPRQVSFQINQQAVTLDISRNYEGQGWVGFTESIGTAYRQRSLPGGGMTENRWLYVRLLKFPSGELPDIDQGGRGMIGGSADGIVGDGQAHIDEVRITAFNPERYVLWNHQDMDLSATSTTGGASTTSAGGIDATTDEIPIANVEWLISNPTSFGSQRFYTLPDGRQIQYQAELQGLPNNNAGLILIDQEIIAYRTVGTGQSGGPALSDCQRGFMNTTPTSHGYGANVVFLDFVNVTMLNDAMDNNSNRLPVAQSRAFDQTGGTVLVDQEMIHFTRVQNGELSMPLRVDSEGESEGGLFRGRFGTQPQNHDVQAIVLEMPFRYWDRFVPEQDSAELAYYGMGIDRPGMFLHKIEFEKYRTSQLTDLEVHVRTDPRIPWSANPGQTAGLFTFEDSTVDQPNLINQAADGCSVRVYFKYLPGAFQPTNLQQHDWKSSPELRNLRITYLDQTQVVSREEAR